MAGPASQREFFAVRTVAETLAGFRPARRTAVETVALDDAHGRVPAAPVRAPHDLPGFARATVDGYAVRAADTYGASEGLPSYLDVTGAVRMGRAPDVEVAPGTAVAMPTGGVMPRRRRRGRDGRAHAGGDARDDRGRPARGAGRRPRARGRGRPRRAPSCCPPAARCAPRTSGCSRPRGSRRSASTPARASRSSPPATRSCRPRRERSRRGQVRDATAPALAALVARGGRRPRSARHRPRRPRGAGRRAARRGRRRPTSSSSRPAPRSARATRPPPSWLGSASRASGAHGIALRPGKPTLLADCGGVPVIGLPGNPRSALVVFRLVGMPLVRLRRRAARTRRPSRAVARRASTATCPRPPDGSTSSRWRVRDGVAAPLFGASALLSVLTAADGYIVVPGRRDRPAPRAPRST